MTPDELDRWSAEVVMGWRLCECCDGYWNKEDYVSSWHPSNPGTGQIWMVVEKMRDKPFSIRKTFIEKLERIIAGKFPDDLTGDQRISGLWNLFYLEPIDILQAVWQVLEEK